MQGFSHAHKIDVHDNIENQWISIIHPESNK